MTDNPDNSYVAALKTPDGNLHYLKDAEVREALTQAEAVIAKLKALAFKDSATAKYTPKGTLSKPELTGSPSYANVSTVTPAYDAESETLTITLATSKVLTRYRIWVAAPVFTGEEADITVS